MCVDYHGINKKIIPYQYPIPRIDELIDTAGDFNGKYLSC